MASLPPGTVILQVTPALNAGGVERTTLDMAEAIARAGGTVLVASAGGRLEGELAACGGRLIRLPLESKNPLTIWRNAGRLARAIRKEKVSLVHVRSRAPAFSAIAAARRCGVPVVTTYHGVYNARSAIKRWYNGIMTRGDLVIANSEFTRAHVIAEHKLDPAKVVAIPRGVDLRQFSPEAVSTERVAAIRAAWGIAPEQQRPVLLLAGRLTRWKGQTLAIEALAGAKVQGRVAILVLAGDDQGRTDYTAELKAMAEGAGVAEAVRFPGHVTDMPAAYLACHFALAPSLDPEAFGRTAVEPQAMGRPVLAANHGATTETVQDGQTGWLVKPGDVAAWTAAMIDALDTPPALGAEMGAAGRLRVEALYSLDRMTERTLEIYARVLAGRG